MPRNKLSAHTALPMAFAPAVVRRVTSKGHFIKDCPKATRYRIRLASLGNSKGQ